MTLSDEPFEVSLEADLTTYLKRNIEIWERTFTECDTHDKRITAKCYIDAYRNILDKVCLNEIARLQKNYA